MIMKVDLFFCGDSNTFGTELEGPEKDQKKRIENRYSSLVAKELSKGAPRDKTHYNISQSGACNDWIVKTVVEWFERGNTCDTAIIQFSHESRWGYYDENGKYESMPRCFASDGKKIEDALGDQYSEYTREAYEGYCSNIWSEKLELDNYWKNMFFLRNYLKDKCEVIWMTLSKIPKETVTHSLHKDTNMWSILCKDMEIGEQVKIVDGNKCIKIDTNQNQMDIKNGKGLYGTHPNEIGHQNIANWILDRIR